MRNELSKPKTSCKHFHMNIFFRPLVVLSILFYCSTCYAQSTRGMQWAKDGASYYATEASTIVQYQLPSFDKVVLVDSTKLKPSLKDKALTVRSFSFSEDGKKVLRSG
jgi:dipeptidyl-peptidase 4